MSSSETKESAAVEFGLSKDEFVAAGLTPSLSRQILKHPGIAAFGQGWRLK
jgi:hypothetical protein